MAMTLIRAFDPLQNGSTQNIVVTGTTQNQVITPNTIGVRSIRFVNSGTQVVFIAFGKDNTVTVTAANGIPILANTTAIFTLDQDISYVAAIAGATGSTLYYTVGQGT